MNSRERVVAAMRKQPVDRVPIFQSFWLWEPEEECFKWNSLEEEFKWRQEYNFDLITSIYAPSILNPAIEHKTFREDVAGEKYPIIRNTWSSEKGALSASLRLTEDYPYGEEIHLFNDYNASRYTKPLLESKEDLETYIAMEPLQVAAGEKFEAWKNEVSEIKRAADKYGAVVAYECGTSLDHFIWGSTPETGIMLVLDYPDECMAFVEHVNDVAGKWLDIVLEMGIDVLERRGWYESADFWAPRHFAKFAAPFIEKAVQKAHQVDIPCGYIMCTGVVPMLEELKKLSFDCLMGIEPVATGQDMRKIVDALGDKKSFCTGLSAPLHIGEGTPQEVRQAVRDAFALFGKTGFLLSAVPSIRRHWPWENVEAMVDEYRKIISS